MGKNILREICAVKKEHIALQKQKCSENMLLTMTETAGKPRGFLSALQTKRDKDETGLIAEIKKASPSRGLIRKDFDPALLAARYEKGGASCLSVLTDEPYFQGDDKFIGLAGNNSNLPVLRKDFIIDPYQVIESRVIGADCILLIMAAVDDIQAAEIAKTARDNAMDVLIEIHDEYELERAMKLESPLIGINNRNLATLAIDLSNTERLAPLIGDDYLVVCESGIYSRADITRMKQIDVSTFLVGESLMIRDDVEKAVRELLESSDRD